MAKIHDGLAGRGQMMFLNLVELAAPPHHQARRVQHGQMFDGALVTATSRRRKFGHGARFAAGEFLEHQPTRDAANGTGQPRQVRQRRGQGRIGNFSGITHKYGFFSQKQGYLLENHRLYCNNYDSSCKS